MNHKESGIRKKVCESVYPADIISDTNLERCSLLARGAWYECLFRMWRDNEYEISGTIDELARLWKVSVEDAKVICDEFARHKPCDVTHSNDAVTLLSRRLQRRSKAKEQAAKRQAKHRAAQACNGDVTSRKALSSFSSSFSTSCIDTPRFLASWKEWVEHRIDIGKPLTAKAIEKQISTFIEFGEEPSIRAISLSIENGWQGVFPKHNDVSGARVRSQQPALIEYPTGGPTH